MAFDPTALEQLAAQLASVAAPILGGALGGPAGAIIAPLVVNSIGAALGVPPTPDAISAAIKADPTGSAGKIAAVEAAQGAAIKSATQAYLDDVANARATEVQYVQSGSSVSWGAPVVSVIIVLGFIGSLLILFFMHSDLPDRVFQLLNITIGILGTTFVQVCNFWLGSSQGSAEKSSQIGSMMQTIARTVAPKAK
jgi:hypothetical protein